MPGPTPAITGICRPLKYGHRNTGSIEEFRIREFDGKPAGPESAEIGEPAEFTNGAP